MVRADGEVLTSFTEPDLDIFRPFNQHSAIINGKKAKGGSSFKKHLTEPFSPFAAINSAKAWGTTVDEVRGLWKDKGKSTAGFGTAFHKVIENDTLGLEYNSDDIIDEIKKTRRLYMKNLDLGARIQKVKKGATENYAKPTHLDIRALMKATDEEIHEYGKKVLQEKKDMYKSLGYDKCDRVAEVYVTYSELGMGGEIDDLIIIDKQKKICRVADFKFKDKVLDKPSSTNTLLHELAKKKATENDIIRIQLSYYAFCLWKAGWTVEGGDVFGRNGKWSYYAIDLIPMEKMEKLLIKYL